MDPTIPGAPHRLGPMAIGLFIDIPLLLFVAIVLDKSAVAPQLQHNQARVHR